LNSNSNTVEWKKEKVKSGEFKNKLTHMAISILLFNAYEEGDLI
jgi:hypothetical protein